MSPMQQLLEYLRVRREGNSGQLMAEPALTDDPMTYQDALLFANSIQSTVDAAHTRLEHVELRVTKKIRMLDVRIAQLNSEEMLDKIVERIKRKQL